MGTQSWELAPLPPSRADFAAAWDGLNARIFGSHAMLDSRFYWTLLDHFGTRDIRLLSCVTGGITAGTMLVERKRPGVWESFVPSQSQICPLVYEPSRSLDVKALFDAMPWSCMRLDLHCVDPAFAPHEFVPPQLVERTTHGITMNVRLSSSFDEYWANRPKKLRSNITRYLRRLDDEKLHYELRTFTAPDDVGRALIRYGELESSGWKGRTGTAIRADSDQGRFYHDTLMHFAATGDAFAFELYFDDRLVASRLCIGSASMLIALKTTYDESMSAFAPGRLILYFALRKMFEMRRYPVVEFYTNANKDQLSWADESREIVTLSLYRNLAIRRAFEASRLLKRGTGPNLGYALKDYTTFEALPKDVRKVWEKCASDSLFSSLDWFENFQEHVGRHLGEMHIFVLENKAGECLAVFPALYIRRYGGLLCELQILGNYYTPWFQTLVNEELIERDEAIRRLLATLSGSIAWDRLAILPLRGEAEPAAFVRAASEVRRPVHRFPVTANWSVEIPDLEAYLAERPSHLKHLLKRKGAKLHREHQAEFRIAASGDELMAAVASYEGVYEQSWKQKEPFPVFIRELVRRAAQKRTVRVGTVMVDGSMAAAQIWFVANKTAYIYKLAHADKYNDLSVGSLLTLHLLRHVVSHDGVRTVDYLTGDDSYKRDWMTTRNELTGISVFNPLRPAGFLLSVKNAVARWLETYRS